MRISAIKGDDGYLEPGKPRQPFTVLLDNKLVFNVISADEEQGCIVYLPCHNGEPLRAGDEWVTRTAFGDVRIERI